MLNNIKSIKILNIIIGTLKKRIELKLFKYNKKMIKKLNIKKEDFEQFILLKEMNIKFKLNIKDIDINKLCLVNKNLENNFIEHLNKIRFNNLNFLILEKNNITDIKGFENANFARLKQLNFKDNKIQDIDILEKVNFKGLKELGFLKNKISDIKVLEKVKFEKLEYLDLGENNISNIDILEKVNFKELKGLYLYENKISDIKVKN